MREQQGIFKNIDWMLVTLYLLLVTMGWLNIYASVYNEEHQSITDFTQKYGKQLIWIVSSLILAITCLILDGKFYATFSPVIYGISLFSLILVLFLGTEISGSKSWFRVGDFGIQPAEFAKFATNLMLAKYLSNINIKMTDFRTKLMSGVIICVPILLILVENETGCALVFVAFIFTLYREGLSGNYLLLGFLAALIFILTLVFGKTILFEIIGSVALVIFLLLKKNRKNILIVGSVTVLSLGAVYSVDYAFDHLEAHQKKRINVFLGKEVDVKKAGYNVNQSLIAIGSGGMTGKGYLQGTQTKYDFVPEQSTDFIFCTVGEEWGFVGSAVVIGLLVFLLLRIIFIAERQRSPFSRIYGYGVASIIFFHLTVNIGMTIGLAPVIGIPLPFFSYGGSSLWSFTVLLFIFIKLDAYRLEVLR
jgi:rod shape determining protein RodA